MTKRVPRDPSNDYTRAMAEARRGFVLQETGVELKHVAAHSFDPSVLPGNIENFIGMAQVPIGLAGPLVIDGEHARGEFFVPMATTEGTLVASYNRGMRVLAASGGVKTTVVERSMQRSAFVMADARAARALGEWVTENFAAIKEVAESTTRIGKLSDIDQHAVGPIRYLRFNYLTGDAAGQNMAGKATLAAAEWIKSNYPGPGLANYVLSGNVDTDKKHSQLNTLFTRGRRVIAEATLQRQVVEQVLGTDPETLFRARQVSNTGAMLAGAANNGAHAANALAALFIACGQDVANVAESHAGIVYAQLLESGDYYWSITLPSLIVASYGGGTSLPTQRECLEVLGCYGQGKADKLAEICAGVVLAGEISLSGAILAGDWVSSHEKHGRNRK